MNENILIPIFTGIIGLFTGLLMPFVKWHIEKLKMRRLDRISFINQLREIISSDGFDIYKFKDTSLYSRFRKHLPAKIVERIDCKNGRIYLELIISRSRGGLQNELLDQIYS